MNCKQLDSVNSVVNYDCSSHLTTGAAADETVRVRVRVRVN